VKSKIGIGNIKKRLAKKLDVDYNRLVNKHAKAGEVFKEKNLQPHRLRIHASRLLAGVTMASSLLAQPSVVVALPAVSVLSDQRLEQGGLDRAKESLAIHKVFGKILPKNRGQLNPWEVNQIAGIFKKRFGIKLEAELEGHRLLDQYGWMGMEQHLKRYPGDSISQHDEMRVVGMASGLGAWRYFVDSKSKMTEKDRMREKYYVAVQTLYLPEWNEQYKRMKKWYVYRKVMVINPENGKAVVAVIGDAGPAKWTEKVFGGSPEVMEKLNLHEGRRKGKVVLLFIDDPDDLVSLGPVD